MKISIHILNILDIVLLFILAIQTDSLSDIIIWTICSGIFFVLVWNIIVEKQESMKNLRWFAFVISIITLIGLIIVFITKRFIEVSNFSLQIPMYIAYLAMLVKVKREGYDE
ncbi:MAG: hypothetical protein J5527_09930 [Treponema sp.]|nr:hypothetical protein [Treponema sp.]